ncbi:hypothetical protein TNCV_1561301 [Trichonephila clavipes]|nr:hypothetical protein TNCV_1561301 [Trichonephila clavipes]
MDVSGTTRLKQEGKMKKKRHGVIGWLRCRYEAVDVQPSNMMHLSKGKQNLQLFGRLRWETLQQVLPELQQDALNVIRNCMWFQYDEPPGHFSTDMRIDKHTFQ